MQKIPRYFMRRLLLLLALLVVPYTIVVAMGWRKFLQSRPKIAGVERLRFEDGMLQVRGIDLDEGISGRFASARAVSLQQCTMNSYNFLSVFKSLERLYVESSEQLDLEFLRDCSFLHEIGLWKTPFSNVNMLSRLERLRMFSATGVAVQANERFDRLRYLTTLSLGNCEIQGLTRILEAPSLEELRLYDCNVDSWNIIRDEVNAFIRRLVLSGSNVRELEWLKILPRVETLDLSRCHTVIDYQGLSHLEELRVLNLSDSNIWDLDAIASLIKLRKLALKGTPIRNLQPLRELRQLESLDISGTEIDSLSGVESLGRLKYLHMSGCKKLESIDAIVNCRELEEIFVPKNVKSVSVLERLPKLKYVSLSERLALSINLADGTEVHVFSD